MDPEGHEESERRQGKMTIFRKALRRGDLTLERGRGSGRKTRAVVANRFGPRDGCT